MSTEHSITKPSGRRGRIDVHVTSDGNLVAVVELKASDWDAMSEAAVRRNARRYCRQIWQYIESQLAGGKEVSPGVIFPSRPGDPERLALVEHLFESDGIPVVWQDEPAAERRKRT